MKTFFHKLSKVIGLCVLGLVLVYTLYEPVLPSRILIQGMGKRIDPQSVPAGEKRVVCFDLGGKGGGVYSLVVRREGVEVVEGEPDQADLILFMQARDFNSLIFSLARGSADATSTFARLTISKTMRIAGDMGVLGVLMKGKETKA